MKNFIKQTLCSLVTALCLVAQVSYTLAQTASLLPMGVQQFFDNNGNPLTSGTVSFYFPSTTTNKVTWQDAGETIPNTNPIVLDAGGKAIIYGQGTYRQIVKDRNNNLIWDAVTAPGGNGGGGTSATGDGDLVGTVKPWAGIIAPNQYAFTYGQAISRTTYSVLLTAITQTVNVICTSGSNTLTGIADTTQIPVGAPIEALCVVPGTTVSSKTTSTVVLSNPSSLTINVAAVFFPFGNGDGSTTFNLPDLRDLVIAGRPNMGGTDKGLLTSTYYGINPAAQGAVSVAPSGQSQTLVATNIPALNVQDSGTGSNAFSGGTGSNAGGPTLLSAASVSNVTTHTLTTGTTLNTAFSIIQPTITFNYIIKILPDVNSAIATGVTSLGGMTGSIACGSGLICTGNNISTTGGVTSGVVGNLAYYSGSTTVSNAANTNITGGALTLGTANTTIGQLILEGSTSGAAIITPQATAGTPTLTLGTSSGTPAVTASSPLVITTATGNIACATCVTSSGGGAITGTPPISVSSAGLVALATPLVGTYGGTGINNGANQINLQGNNLILNTGTFNVTLTPTATTNSTLPAGTHTLAGLDVAQTWSALQGFNSSDLGLNGTTGQLKLNCAATCGTNTLTFPGGTTDFSSTGGTSQVVKQISSGAALTVGQLAASDLSNGVTGSGAVVLANTPTLITPVLGVANGTSLALGGATIGSNALAVTGTTALSSTLTSTAHTITSASANALAVGLNGTTTPAFNVNASTSLQAAGLNITGAATGGTVAIAAIDSGSNTNITINAKGTGTIGIGSVSTGIVTITPATTITGALTLSGGLNTPLAVAQGGTASATALAARNSSGLNIDQATSIGDTNGTIASTTRTSFHSALTAARSDTLPAANALNAGQILYINDINGVASASNTVTLARASSDTINGGTTFVAINAAYGIAQCQSDGTSKWDCAQVAGGGGGGGVTSVTIAAGTGLAVSGTCAITSSGTCTVALSSARQTLPTYQYLVSGTNATYTAPAGALWIEIRMVGGGGGGAGAGTVSPGNGTNGSDTCIKVSGTACTTPLYDAGGGGGCTSGVTPGTPGAVSGSATSTTFIPYAGQTGAAGTLSTVSLGAGSGGTGGSAVMFGGAGVGVYSANGSAALANTGAGGGGGGVSAAATNQGSCGGSSGASIYIPVLTAANFVYTIGSNGSGGAAGTNGFAGAAGGTGGIIVVEHYGT